MGGLGGMGGMWGMDSTYIDAYARTLNNFACLQDSVGLLPEAEQLYCQALELLQSRGGMGGSGGMSIILTMENLALVLDAQGKVGEAAMMKRAVSEGREWVRGYRELREEVLGGMERDGEGRDVSFHTSTQTLPSQPATSPYPNPPIPTPNPPIPPHTHNPPIPTPNPPTPLLYLNDDAPPPIPDVDDPPSSGSCVVG